ncbi:MAG: flagellar export protein FliJ [Planctomycetes bacterium]|nr:flagellar export protein FliJ [Planctomycetota bacterium]
MIPFRFRLESLLRIRRDERDAARRAHAQAVDARRIVEDRIGSAEEELAETRNRAAASAAPGAVDVDRLMHTHRYALLLGSRVGHLRGQAAKIDEEIARRMEQLAKADREVRLLEKLRERKLETHREDAFRREQRAIDEMAQQVSLRRGDSP